MVSMNSVLADDIKHVPADIYLMTHTTNPLLTKATIEAAIDAYEKSNGEVDSLFTVNRHQARFYRQDGEPINHDLNNLVRTQDLEPWYEENSNLYIFTRNSFEKSNSRIGRKPMMFETPYMESFDIDTPEDWSLCEILSKHLASPSN
jgi:CMP-N-acetylneuraminic acid synthetase